MGKSTVSMVIFNSYLTNYQRVEFLVPCQGFIMFAIFLLGRAPVQIDLVSPIRPFVPLVMFTNLPRARALSLSLSPFLSLSLLGARPCLCSWLMITGGLYSLFLTLIYLLPCIFENGHNPWNREALLCLSLSPKIEETLEKSWNPGSRDIAM